MFRNLLLLVTITLCGTASAENFRPYIATRLAQAIMSSSDILPDNDEPVELCNGSGWITHGDGHRTRCPGCPACESQQQIVKEPVGQEADFIVYHMGAEWCAPCKQLKNQTWQDNEVKKFMRDNKIKLSFLDYDTRKDKEYFTFYNVRSLPTVLFVQKGNLKNVEKRMVGFVGPREMLSIMQEELNEK